MTSQALIDAVEAGRRGIGYAQWTVGITADPERRKTEHGSPALWQHWKADSEPIARGVERYFLDKGMKGDTGGGLTPTYVYIF